MEEKKNEQTYSGDLRFATFIASLATGAFQQMGKIANPMTGAIEKDLDGAKATIDMLVMLQEKTKGNLSHEEKQLLDSYVTNLQLNYVEESKRPDVSQKKEEKKDEKVTQETPEAKKAEEKKEESDSKVKWSKKYTDEEKEK